MINSKRKRVTASVSHDSTMDSLIRRALIERVGSADPPAAVRRAVIHSAHQMAESASARRLGQGYYRRNPQEDFAAASRSYQAHLRSTGLFAAVFQKIGR